MEALFARRDRLARSRKDFRQGTALGLSLAVAGVIAVFRFADGYLNALPQPAFSHWLWQAAGEIALATVVVYGGHWLWCFLRAADRENLRELEWCRAEIKRLSPHPKAEAMAAFAMEWKTIMEHPRWSPEERAAWLREIAPFRRELASRVESLLPLVDRNTLLRVEWEAAPISGPDDFLLAERGYAEMRAVLATLDTIIARYTPPLHT